MEPPEGTVTFLFTDIEGSTRLWESEPSAMSSALATHDSLIASLLPLHQGWLVKGTGDGILVAFSDPLNALTFILSLQRTLAEQIWPTSRPLRIRAALHTGIPQKRDNDYFGPSLNRTARLLSLGYGQQTLLSAATYELIRDRLPTGITFQDLGQHRMKDLTRPENVYQVIAPDLPDQFPPLKSLETLPHNLPVQLTSFIGRERELSEVAEMVRTRRLVTLTGSGGCGKTRLCLQAGAELVDDFTEGVYLIELASLLPSSDEAMVAQTLAQAVGVREDLGTPMRTTLERALKEKRLLLLLDNCEHLLAVCSSLVASLLRACPSLHFLVTSREALGILGETVYRVPSLGMPELPPASASRPAFATAVNTSPLTAEALSQFDSVRLFVDRALSVFPAFSVTNASAPHLAELCVRLDGIPLAIELAAARIKSLSVEQITSRLGQRFHLLTTGNRTALPRQQTLRALVDWSYTLLSESERLLLRRLSVFAGGWSLESAESIGSTSPEDGLPAIEAWEVLDLLASLVEKSLVLFDGESGRYRMLETIRQYSQERLRESGEAVVYALCSRHRDRMQEVAETLWTLFMEDSYSESREHFLVELDNFRAALQFCQQDIKSIDSAEAGAWIPAYARDGFLMMLREGLHWMEIGRSHPSLNPQNSSAAWLDNALGFFKISAGDFVYASHFLQSCPERHQAHGDLIGECDARFFLSWALFQTEEFDAAREQIEKALALSRQLGMPSWEATHWNCLGLIAQESGDLPGALTCFEEGLRLYKTMPSRDTATAEENLGYVHVLFGNFAEARKCFITAYEMYGEFYLDYYMVNLVDSVGALACATGEFIVSVRLNAMSNNLREQSGFVRETYVRKAAERNMARAREALGDVAFRSEQEATKGLSREEVMRFLREWLET